MSDDRTVNKVFLGKPDGRRKAGIPKLRWLHCTENDLKSMGVKRWKKKADGRSVWVIILKGQWLNCKDSVPMKKKKKKKKMMMMMMMMMMMIL
jgi:hypothetical protein